MVPDTFRDRFREVSDTLHWPHDESARVLWLPRWWRYNLPANPKHLRGCLDDLHEVPDSPLIHTWAQTWDDLEGLTKPFVDTLSKRFAQRMANGYPNGIGLVSPQEQEQEQEQEQDCVGDTVSTDGRKTEPDARQPALPEALGTPEAASAWERWLGSVAARGLEYPPEAQQAALERFAVLGPARFCAAIRYSLAGSYRSAQLYEPTGGSDGGPGDRAAPPRVSDAQRRASRILRLTKAARAAGFDGDWIDEHLLSVRDEITDEQLSQVENLIKKGASDA